MKRQLEASEIEPAFKRLFNRDSVAPFQSFDCETGEGVPSRVKLFKTFNPCHVPFSSLTKWSGERFSANDAQFQHMLQYFQYHQFTKETLLVGVEYDYLSHAIVSYLMSWDEQSLTRFGVENPTYQGLCHELEAFIAVENGAYVFSVPGHPQVPCCLAPHKFIKLCFKQPKATSTEYFHWFPKINSKFVKMCASIFEAMQSNSVTPEMIEWILEDTPIPYELDTICVEKLREAPKSMKYISGSSCSGKTTTLQALADDGWDIYSRGDLGGFNTKLKNPVQVAMLHAAVGFQLSTACSIGG